MVGHAHEQKVYEGAVDRHGQQNAMLATLVGFAKIDSKHNSGKLVLTLICI